VWSPGSQRTLGLMYRSPQGKAMMTAIGVGIVLALVASRADLSGPVVGAAVVAGAGLGGLWRYRHLTRRRPPW
jgi:hypothetical protein